MEPLKQYPLPRIGMDGGRLFGPIVADSQTDGIDDDDDYFPRMDRGKCRVRGVVV